MRPNWPLYSNGDNKVVVDFVGRYEKMDEDWDRVCRLIGISPPPLAKINSYREEVRHYSHYYDEWTRRKVAEIHEAEIRFFSYRFEERRMHRVDPIV